MRYLAVLLALFALTACQVVERIAGPAETPPVIATAPRTTAPATPSGPEDLIAYLTRLRGMNESAIMAEATRQKQLAARAPDDLTRLKAALALMLAQSEDAEILALVDPLARKQHAGADVRAMASFLQVLIVDRRRLRESAAAARTTLSAERRALEAQKQRADALQQKLDALTELEKSLSERPQPGR